MQKQENRQPQMHSRNVVALSAVFAAALLLYGCGDDADYSKYVTLGEYKGLSADYHVEPVSDEELAELEQENLDAYVSFEVKDAPVAEGDMAEVLLTAESDGEMLYDFSDSGYEMVVGDEEFDVEVDEKLIGAKAGDVLDFTVTHTNEFTDMVLSGKTVDYHIEVVSVSNVVEPELTDAFVQEHFSADSVEEWHEQQRAQLMEEHEAEAREQMRSDLVQAAVDASQISGYPKALYEQKKQDIDNSYQNYMDMLNVDASVEEVYEMLGTNAKEVKQEYIDETNRTMVLTLIREQEGITLSESELEKKLEAYAKEDEYDTVEELLSDYDEEGLRNYFLDEMTVDFLEKHANITEN